MPNLKPLRRWVRVVIVGLLGTGLSVAHASGQAPQPQSLDAAPGQSWAEGLAAYEKHDYVAYLRAFEAVAKVAPDHPMVLTRLASAYALNKRPTEAIRILSRLVDFGVWTEIAANNDFASLVSLPDAAGLRLRLQALREKKVQNGVVAFRLTDRTLVPEGVAFDPKTGAYFVSSQFQRKIVRRTGDGVVKDFVTSAQDGVWMVFGIAADPVRRVLWATSTAEETMLGATAQDAGGTALFAFDLDTGALKHRYLPPPGTEATFDDLALGNDGEVFVSDSATGAIYVVLRDAQQLAVLIPPGQLGSPQGMALSADGKRLYVSDYGRGIFAIELQAGVAIRLRTPSNPTLLGFDGLQRSGACLIAVQNGVAPSKVMRLRLGGDGLSIDSAEVLDMNLPEMDEPTLGVVSTEGFVYVANSQDSRFRSARGNFLNYTAAEPVLLKIPTAKLCP